MLLYLVRHGDPDYKTDTLTEIGKEQAILLAKRLASSELDEIYTSPKGRAIATAQPTCELIGKEATVLEWAREIGKKTTIPDGVEKSISSTPNIYTRPDMTNLDFEDGFEAGPFAGTDIKEAYTEIRDGARALLAELGYVDDEGNGVFRITEPNEKRIALFCHGNMGRTLISYLLHIPVNVMWSNFGYPHTGVTVIDFKNFPEGITLPRVLHYGDISHLYKAGEPLIYNTVRNL